MKTAQLGTSIRRNQAGNGEENPKPPGSGRVPCRLRHVSRRRSETENKGYAGCLSGSQPRGVDKRGAASRSPAPAFAGTEGERKGREPVCPVNFREGSKTPDGSEKWKTKQTPRAPPSGLTGRCLGAEWSAGSVVTETGLVVERQATLGLSSQPRLPGQTTVSLRSREVHGVLNAGSQQGRGECPGKGSGTLCGRPRAANPGKRSGTHKPNRKGEPNGPR